MSSAGQSTSQQQSQAQSDAPRFTADTGWRDLMRAHLRDLPVALSYARRNRRAIRNLTGKR